MAIFTCPQCGNASNDEDLIDGRCRRCWANQPHESPPPVETQQRSVHVTEFDPVPKRTVPPPTELPWAETNIRRSDYGESLAVLALLLPLVAQGIAVACFSYSPGIATALSFGTVIVTALVLALDAALLGTIDINGTRRSGPVALFFGMVVLWIVVYPAVFFRRRHFGRPNLGFLALLVAGLFVALPILSNFARFSVVEGVPTCASREVVSMVDDLIRQSPMGPSVQSISGHRELSHDSANLIRKGQCVVKTQMETFTATYTVKIVNRENGTFQVEVDPFDPPQWAAFNPPKEDPRLIVPPRQVPNLAKAEQRRKEVELDVIEQKKREVDQEISKAVARLKKNVQVFCDARQSKVTWLVESQQRNVVGPGWAVGSATVRMLCLWATTAQAKNLNANPIEQWKECTVDLELANGTWRVRTFIKGVQVERPTRVLFEEAELQQVLSDTAEPPLDQRSGFWLNEGRVQARLGQWDLANAHFTKSIELNPGPASPWNERGVAFFNKGDLDRAIADFSQAIDRNPNDPVPWTNRGEAYGRQRKWDKTIADCSNAIQVQADYALAWLNRGSAHASLEQWPQAETDFAKAATFPKTAQRAWSYSALIHLHLKDQQAYRQDSSRLLENWTEKKDPSDALTVAWACSIGPDEDTNLERLIEFLDSNKAMVLRPENDYVYHRALGAALYRTGKAQESIDTFMKGLEKRKTPAPAVWLFLAMGHHQLGETEVASQWFEKARSQIEAMSKKDAEVQPGSLSWTSVPWNERVGLKVVFREADELLTKI